MQTFLAIVRVVLSLWFVGALMGCITIRDQQQRGRLRPKDDPVMMYCIAILVGPIIPFVAIWDLVTRRSIR